MVCAGLMGEKWDTCSFGVISHGKYSEVDRGQRMCWISVLRVLGVSSSSLSEILSLTLQCIFQYGTVIAEAEDIQR